MQYYKHSTNGALILLTQVHRLHEKNSVFYICYNLGNVILKTEFPVRCPAAEWRNI